MFPQPGAVVFSSNETLLKGSKAFQDSVLYKHLYIHVKDISYSVILLVNRIEL